MKLINLGCGNKYHKDWINLDFKSKNDDVQEFNLNNKLPFEDNSIDVIYSSHVLEHFAKCDAPKFLEECYRILKPNGIIRIVVPDLEQLMRNYIKFLDGSKKNNQDSQEKYEWTMIEIFDQMVRNYPGGEMLKYWKQDPMPQKEFILKRLGSEVKNFLTSLKKSNKDGVKLSNVRQSDAEIGKFRMSGEIHQWMYDEYSLGKILGDAMFQDISKVTYDKSKIEFFNKYYLDVDSDGNIRKPDSLFIEAIK